MVSFVYSPPKVEISILWVLMVIKVGYLRSLCRIRWQNFRGSDFRYLVIRLRKLFSSSRTSQCDASCREFFIFYEIFNHAVDFPRCTLGPTQQISPFQHYPTFISVVRSGSQYGFSSAIGARHRGGRIHGGSHRVTYSVSRCGQCYTIPTRIKVKVSDTVIIGIFLVCYRSTSILFYIGSIFNYVCTYFNVVFGVLFQPLLCLFIFLPS